MAVMDKTEIKARTLALFKKGLTKEVMNEIVVLNEGLIYSQINKLHLKDNDDALSEAYNAMFNAITTYDYEKDATFSSYATVCIYNSLGCLIRTMHTQFNKSITSYDKPLDEDGNLFLLDILESSDTSDGHYLSNETVKIIDKAVTDTCHKWHNNTHKDIILTWRESGYTMLQSDIAETLGITQTYVSQVINKFRKELKKKLEVYKVI